MYIPAMTTLVDEFGTTDGAMQITLIMYTIGFAIGQLFYGPVTDSFGRRNVLFSGTLIFAITSLACTLITTIDMLIYCRTIQGFSGAASAVIVQAIVRDMFKREDFSRTMSFITLVMTLAPLLAPLIGGYLLHWFNWRVIFAFFAFFSLSLVLVSFWLIPETLPKEKRHKLHFLSSLKNYARLFTNINHLGLLLSSALSFGGMFAFLTAGSIIYIRVYGIAREHFGYFFALNILSLITMTWLNTVLVKSKGIHWMLRLGLSLQLLAGIGLLVCGILDIGLYGVVPCVMLFIGCISIVGSNAVALILSHYPTITGTAASLNGTLRFGLGSAVGAILAQFPSTPLSMLSIMAACALLSNMCYWLLGRHVE